MNMNQVLLTMEEYCPDELEIPMFQICMSGMNCEDQIYQLLHRKLTMVHVLCQTVYAIHHQKEISIIMKSTGSWPVAHILSFYPWSKLNFFSFYWQQFPRYGPISKIAIFEHETWQKFPKQHIPSLSTPGVEIELIFTLRATVKEIEQFDINEVNANLINCYYYETNNSLYSWAFPSRKV